ncbi:MAG: hypothetical protein A3J76_03425 [Candidatus Moranbacteria bacterium RBG_13_45_13]|nr:MAG: hypothetical protein A3J76_03425 [Candidatus Moranbacteria bacterium RBG_13_45_13]
MPSAKFESRLTKSIFQKSLESTGIICLALFECGKITLDSFFPRQYSFSRPYRKLLGLEIVEWPKRNTFLENLRRLKKQGIIEKKKNILTLSKVGQSLIRKIINKKKALSQKWDGKYRLVIFDIPENKKWSRNWLRKELYLLQYIQLQKSVFVGKHPLPVDIIKDIKKFGLEKYVNYLLIDKLYDRSRLKHENFH